MDWINEKAKTLRQGAIRAMFDKASTMDNVISMGIGEPDMATPELVCRAGNEALEKGITHYTPNAGTPALRRAIAEKSNLKGVGYDPTTEIIITNGGMGALSLLFLVLLNPASVEFACRRRTNYARSRLQPLCQKVILFDSDNPAGRSLRGCLSMTLQAQRSVFLHWDAGELRLRQITPTARPSSRRRAS